MRREGEGREKGRRVIRRVEVRSEYLPDRGHYAGGVHG
jgi:hypothetical protein